MLIHHTSFAVFNFFMKDLSTYSDVRSASQIALYQLLPEEVESPEEAARMVMVQVV